MRMQKRQAISIKSTVAMEADIRLKILDDSLRPGYYLGVLYAPFATPALQLRGIFQGIAPLLSELP